MTIYQILMYKYQTLFTNDQRLLKFTTLKGVRKNSYEFISFLCKTNPKSSRPKINISSFVTSKYVLIGHLVIQTAKPIQSQFKPIQSQFVENGEIDTKFSYTRAYEENMAMGQKTNPIKANQSQFQTQSSLEQTTRFATIGKWLCNGTPKVAIGKTNRKRHINSLRKVVEKC